MKWTRFKILNAVFMLAFIWAGISPACAFVSGKAGYINICAADGSLKTIKISEDSETYAIFRILDKDKDKQKDQKHNKKPTCGFCFANSTLTKTLTSSQSLKIVAHKEFLPVGAGSIAFKSATFHHFQSRGPPLSS